VKCWRLSAVGLATLAASAAAIKVEWIAKGDVMADQWVMTLCVRCGVGGFPRTTAY